MRIKSKNIIQVFEYETLFVGFHNFSNDHFDEMVKFNDKSKCKYFNIGYKKVSFCNYVGVIQIGNLTIEILPKVDRNSNKNEEVWFNILLRMLSYCKKIQIDKISESDLAKRYNSLLDVYYEMFLDELESLIKKGLIKKYRKLESNRSSLKGKLLFGKNVQKNNIHKENFYCEYQSYDQNHLIHQVLYQALLIVENIVPTNLKGRLKKVEYFLLDLKKINTTKKDIDSIKFSRKNYPYKRALNIAEMIIFNYSPSLSSGYTNMLTLLFDMNKLWEEFIYVILSKHKPNNTIVSFQNQKTFWKNDYKIKTIRPDIVIKDSRFSDIKFYIIDTKWKVRDNTDPDDADLKQMFSYNLLWKSEKSLLLYPYVDQKDSEFGNYKYLHREQKDNEMIVYNNQCKMGYINIVEGKGLKSTVLIAEEILKKLKIAQFNQELG